MKNRILNLFLIGSIVLSVILSSCSKDDFGDDTTTGDSDTFTDSRDGKTYQWVKIGNQTWMAENLAYTGNDIQHIVDGIDFMTNNDFDAWCYYDNNSLNSNKYGVLYQWKSAEKACPEGWHIPSDTEWQNLKDYLIENGFSYDGIIGNEGIAKSLASSNTWDYSENQGSVGNSDFSEVRNKTGFSALAGGTRGGHDGNFSSMGFGGYWRSSTEHEDVYTGVFSLIHSYSEAIIGDLNKLRGMSVRCIKN